jgi:hypothetical protein
MSYIKMPGIAPGIFVFAWFLLFPVARELAPAGLRSSPLLVRDKRGRFATERDGAAFRQASSPH